MSLISKIKGKKKITIGIVCLLILSIVAGFGYYQVQKGKKSDTKVVTKETEVKSGNLTVGITESGNVAIDTLTQSVFFKPDFRKFDINFFIRLNIKCYDNQVRFFE